MRTKERTKFKIDEITLILIVALLAMIVSINNELDNDIYEPEAEVEKITAMILDDHELSFANDGVIDDNKLSEIQSMDYNDLKKLLKAKNDFCIYIEDEDGNIILSKGPDKLTANDIHCIE